MHDPFGSESLVTNMRDDIAFLKETIKVAQKARDAGNHPFGALLVSKDGEILMEMGNCFVVDRGPGHAETNLAREAAKKYEPEFLETCTLYTSIEPCSMCSGTIYWAGIGRVVYGVPEARLAQLTGDNPENLTADLDCRTVLGSGQRDIEVVGPFPELEEEVLKGHEGFW